MTHLEPQQRVLHHLIADARGLQAPTAPGTGHQLLLQAGRLEVAQGKSFGSPWLGIQESALSGLWG